MSDIVDDLRRQLEAEPLQTDDEVEAFRIKYLGRKNGLITGLFKRINEVSAEERRTFGQRVNELKALAENRLDEARSAHSSTTAPVAAGLDLTLPGRRPILGSTHPLTQTLDEIKRVFARLGFDVAEGPEIEDDWHNFTALNFPPDHPARDMQDTFFLETPGPDGEGGVVLRTHTSPVQIRVMEKQPPPVRVIVPGRVYRNEAISYKSFCLFHQVEGLYVDEGVSFADLKQILHLFAQTIFGEDVKMRFRPSFFPFTEPSAEVDVWSPNPGLPEGGRWLEILGCGMVDPNVFTSVGIDPERYTGYAFGMGVERIAMLRYGIDDIRTFYENDVRFLEQF
ncbi:MAG TPA: phenylalanine--tRNA ligase subunit alpha [Rhodothermales bacterium]|nr:phenylalanine--tRNA ligase subunit alpha [Rhodothermales bacterium]